MNRVIVIIGSSRNDGDAQRLGDELAKVSEFDRINLNDFSFSYYDYEHKNANDDYIHLIRRLIDHYDTFVFATPVYWYAMSGIMKVFFDRINDLLDLEAELGKRLRGKNMAVITCSAGNNLGDDFWLPFKETAKYFGMEYIGNLHTLSNQINELELERFVGQIIRRPEAGELRPSALVTSEQTDDSCIEMKKQAENNKDSR